MQAPFPILPDKYIAGINHVEDDAVLCQFASLDDLFKLDFDSDVHFMCYALRDEGELDVGAKHPRINKPALTSIRELGGEVYQTAITLDFDLQDQAGTEELPRDDEDKPCWSHKALKLFLAEFTAIGHKLHGRGIGRPDIYTTNHGARLIHQLARPVVCELGEDLTRGLIDIYAELGVVLDPRCSDWTRLFRAPRVTRSGKKTWEQEWYRVVRGYEYTNAKSIPPKAKVLASGKAAATYNKIIPITDPQPTPEQAFSRLWIDKGNKRVPTDACRRAKEILRGTDAYGPAFDFRPLAQQGSRDSTLIRIVGLTINHLVGPQARGFTFTPEDVYALLLPAVEQLKPDSGTPDWTVSLWSKVCSCFAKERAKEEQRKEQQKEEERRAGTAQVTMLAALKETCELPELHDADEVTIQTAFQRLLLIQEPSGRYRAMRRDGSYTQIAVPQGSLHFLIAKAANIGDMLPLAYEDKKGEWKAMPENALARSSVNIQRVEGGVGFPRSYIYGKTWDSLVLVTQLYRRNPNLSPAYNPLVNEWLDRLTPEPQTLKRWLSRALDFESGPICALSLAGAAGAGKGLLAQGLVETLETPVRADKTALISRFNPSLAYSPFLIVDEGLPTGVHDIADTFRSFTAGEPIVIEEKYQSPKTIRNPLRILFTANNLDALTQLASNRLNDDNDQDALSIRILHLPVLDDASEYLRAMGGIEHTRGWVQGASGSDSQFILARHLLWLHEHRDDFGPPDRRFLVEGRSNSEVIQSLRTSGRFAQAIVRAILGAIEPNTSPSVKSGVSFEHSRLCVTIKAIEEQHKLQKSTNTALSVNITTVQISKALRNLISPGTEPAVKKRRLTRAGTVENLRWYDIDLRLLYDFADGAGYSTAVLESLMTPDQGKE